MPSDGKEYEIIITNLSGFYRYRIRDVIRVLGYEGESPKITFSYRKSQLLDLAGDKITESMMDEAIRRLAVIIFFFMAMGAFIGSFEEVIPLVPIVVALAVSLGWDAQTGLAISLLLLGVAIGYA